MMLGRLGVLNAVLTFDIFKLMMGLLGQNPIVSQGGSAFACCVGRSARPLEARGENTSLVSFQLLLAA